MYPVLCKISSWHPGLCLLPSYLLFIIRNMNRIIEIPRSVFDLLGSYVYVRTDPRDGQILYIGKGAGNRVFFHV